MTMQLQFQHSFVVFKVPQLQFIDRVVVTSVASQRQGSKCKLCSRPLRSHRSRSWLCC